MRAGHTYAHLSFLLEVDDIALDCVVAAREAPRRKARETHATTL
jgi:hypothetical protein